MNSPSNNMLVLSSATPEIFHRPRPPEGKSCFLVAGITYFEYVRPMRRYVFPARLRISDRFLISRLCDAMFVYFEVLLVRFCE